MGAEVMTDSAYTQTSSMHLLLTAALSAGLAVSQAAMAESPQTAQGDQAMGDNTDIGTVDFQVDCDGAVRAGFDRALGLMHHMMYEQARAEFLAITEADPECAMAHWGVATTLFQPLWGTRPSPEELEMGMDHIQQARALLPQIQDPRTAREQMLVEATAAFYEQPPGASVHQRLRAWADGMADAYRVAPDDHDTAALYALSRLTLGQHEDDHRDALHDEAEVVLRDIWQQEPEHPGAIHYAIHATDVDNRAENALDKVEAYGNIAPEVPHALHMPSHIYVRLGEWPEVIDWNRRSADAVLAQPENGALSHHYIHAMDYLLYAYLQQGEDHRAQAVMAETDEHHRHQETFVSAFHVAAMPARLAVERRDWEQAAALESRPHGYLPWEESRWAEGLTWYARGLGGAHTGNTALAGEAEQRLVELRDQARDEGDDNFATYIEVDRLILAGRLAQVRGDAARAEELMRAAAELERTEEKHPVTPGALLPPNEALGDLLLELDRPDQALEAYQAAEAIWPGRYNTLLGAARAAHEAGDDTTARDYYSQLLAIAGESGRAGVMEAREFVERA